MIVVRLLCCLLLLTGGVCESTNEEHTSSIGNMYRGAKLFLGFIFHLNKRETSQKRGLEVIGGGFMRTGTKSTEYALNLLGHKVYDTSSMLKYNHVDKWLEAAKAYRKGDLKPLEEVVGVMESLGYTATLDFPMNLFAVPLAEVRPKAKVLTTIRDNQEKWYDSFVAISEITKPLFCLPWRYLLGDLIFTSKLVNILYEIDVGYTVKTARLLPWYEYVVSTGIDNDVVRAKWLAIHDKVIQHQQETLSPERLLMFNVKQGWKPLLRFLEIDDPDFMESDFPRHNDRKSLQTVSYVLDAVGMFLPFWVLLTCYGMYRLMGACFFSKTPPKPKRKRE